MSESSPINSVSVVPTESKHDNTHDNTHDDTIYTVFDTVSQNGDLSEPYPAAPHSTPEPQETEGSNETKNDEEESKNIDDEDAEIDNGDIAQSEERTVRYFTCCVVDENGQEQIIGRYSGLKPKQAAAKALTRLFQQKRTENDESKIVFGIKECTRGRKPKTYMYEGQRQKLAEPEEIEIKMSNGAMKKISYTHTNRIVKYTHPVPPHIKQPVDDESKEFEQSDTSTVIPPSPVIKQNTLSKDGNQANRPRRIYIDGIFDLFHRGHVESLRKAREFLNGPVELIVGVISDADATAYKRKPIYNEEDRYMIIRAISYVDEVILGAPLIMTKEFVDRHRIDCIVHGFSDPKDFDKQKEFFKEVSDIFYQIPYYKHLSTTEILDKIKQSHPDK